MGFMNFNEWLESVPAELKGDPLWKMEAYRLALFASDVAWPDVSKLCQDRRTISLSDQLYRAVGSIGTNIAEGYSRQSSKDQARLYEYALGSAREARHWYYKARHVLTVRVAIHRVQLHTQIIRLLLTMIPNERGYSLREEATPYAVTPDVLTNIPMTD
jgi:four helix bundle protein